MLPVWDVYMIVFKGIPVTSFVLLQAREKLKLHLMMELQRNKLFVKMTFTISDNSHRK